MNKGKIRAGHFCEQCNKPLLYVQTWPSIIKKGEGRFCSRKCCELWRSENLSGENAPCWRGGKVERACEFCNAPFFARQDQVRKGSARFCSRKCKGHWQSKNSIGERSPGWKGGKVAKNCFTCDGVFLVKPFEIARGYGRFCSRKCYGKWYSENMVGARSHTWRGGKSFEPYPISFNRSFKRRIRERDNYTCAMCDKAEVNQVHHIDYVKKNTVPENCITLCRPCHSKTNSKRDYWQVRLTKLMQERGFTDYKVSILGMELHWVEEE